MASIHRSIRVGSALIAIAASAGVIVASNGATEQSLYVSVLDHGTPVGGLTADNFELSIDGVRRPFALATPEPLRLAVVAENTLALRRDYGRYVPLALEALAKAAPHDGHYMLASVAQQLSVVVPFTDDTAAFDRAYYDAMPTVGMPALWDGLYRTVDVLEPYGGRRAVIVLTSGEDESIDHTFDDVLTRVDQSAVAVLVCGIGVGDVRAIHDWTAHERQFADPELRLRMLASAGAGDAWFPLGQFSMATAMHDIMSRLRLEYRLVFVPDVASALTSQWIDAAIVVTIVAATAAVGYSREYNAHAAAEALSRRLHARVEVVRDGKPRSMAGP
jgi:hypothetical protein